MALTGISRSASSLRIRDTVDSPTTLGPSSHLSKLGRNVGPCLGVDTSTAAVLLNGPGLLGQGSKEQLWRHDIHSRVSKAAPKRSCWIAASTNSEQMERWVNKRITVEGPPHLGLTTGGLAFVYSIHKQSRQVKRQPRPRHKGQGELVECSTIPRLRPDYIPARSLSPQRLKAQNDGQAPPQTALRALP